MEVAERGSQPRARGIAESIGRDQGRDLAEEQHAAERLRAEVCAKHSVRDAGPDQQSGSGTIDSTPRSRSP